MGIKIRGDIATPSANWEFTKEILDVKRDSLAGSFPGRYKPEGLLLSSSDDTDDPYDALEYVSRDLRDMGELQDVIHDHIRFGNFRIMEHGGAIIGFAMAMQERSLPRLAYRRLMRQTPRVKLGHLYVRAEYQDTSGHNPPVVQLGSQALRGFHDTSHAISFAAEEDWFVPDALKLLGMEKHPVAPIREDTKTLGTHFDPLHIAKYETRNVIG